MSNRLVICLAFLTLISPLLALSQDEQCQDVSSTEAIAIVRNASHLDLPLHVWLVPQLGRNKSGTDRTFPVTSSNRKQERSAEQHTPHSFVRN